MEGEFSLLVNRSELKYPVSHSQSAVLPEEFSKLLEPNGCSGNYFMVRSLPGWYEEDGDQLITAEHLGSTDPKRCPELNKLPAERWESERSGTLSDASISKMVNMYYDYLEKTGYLSRHPVSRNIIDILISSTCERYAGADAFFAASHG